ncbi:MAG: threonine ammonia-lyase [Pyrinomonadaceae bacterium]|nr:threonine ammonia-lyase [Pyrinomonadaceae bacterium]
MAVTLDDIKSARRRIAGVINQTPVIADARLSRETGAGVHLKAESLQKSGSFKIRGAYNKISQLADDEKSRGVIAASAGNHAQGVALAARYVGIAATIVLPEFAPLTKVNATRGYGAEVILKGATFDEAVAYSKELQKENGLTYVHAYDDERIIAGQGTIGMEIVESLPDVTTIIVPIGGGGVMSGIAIAAKSLKPSVRIIGVQSAAVSWVKPSLVEGRAVIPATKPTIADGIAVKTPGELTLPIIREYVDEIVEVDDEEIAEAIFHSVQNNRLVVEGAGAAGLAAVLSGKIAIAPGESICVVLAGGNIDANLLTRVLEHVLVRHGRYVMFSVLVVDRPGNLAGLLDAVAAAGANVIEVFHRRAMWLAPLGHVGIEMLLEVRDNDHALAIHSHLKAAGYHITREGHGDWEN